MKVSVLTLVRGRDAQLRNLVYGLNAQQQKPDELVIAWMQPQRGAALPQTAFPVRHIHVTGQALPLARARNAAAATAGHEGLIFLDVDCIPAPMLVARYARALATRRALFLGEVHYLPADAVRGCGAEPLDFERLRRLGERHPARPALADDALQLESDYGQLWGSSFAISRDEHRRVGGMDEGYSGYGGEETDYALRVAEAGLPLYWVGNALAWHQHHPIHKPPLQHFDAIIANARRFYGRWNRWCMEYWLGLFRDAGLIEWSEQSTAITLLRRPDAAEIRASRLDGAACFG